MDVGVGLDHLKGLPSADKLGWEWEFVSTDDVEVQHAYMWGDANDDNGVLLYPDRDPRFMIIYTGGGYGDHAGPVGATGIKNVQDFFDNGGSYVGTCNGNYMAWNWAYKLWPGQIKVDSYEGQVDGVIPDDSPLLRYYDFGGDHLISSGLMHYKGGYETGTLPAGTEVLLIGKSHPDAGVIDGDGQVTGYAYKPKETSGRVCGINDHPEYANQPGEIMNYLQAAFRYARDGLGTPDVKAALANGEERVMDKSSGDNDPAHAKIGDKQYHHFTVSLPDGATNLTVALTADDTLRHEPLRGKGYLRLRQPGQSVGYGKGCEQDPDGCITRGGHVVHRCRVRYDRDRNEDVERIHVLGKPCGPERGQVRHQGLLDRMSRHAVAAGSSAHRCRIVLSRGPWAHRPSGMTFGPCRTSSPCHASPFSW